MISQKTVIKQCEIKSYSKAKIIKPIRVATLLYAYR